MIVDTNASLGDWPFRRLAYSSPRDFVELMDATGVAQAWVGPFEGLFYRDMAAANRLLCERIAGYEDRLLPWAVINPNFPGWEDDLAEAVDAGATGIRLYPNYHAYGLLDECAASLLGRVSELGLPVAIYHKVVDERLHHWHCLVPPAEVDLAALVGRFPEVTYLLCGLGLPTAQQYADLIRSHRVYLEISRLEGVEALAALCGTVGSDHVVFGTHAPYFYAQAAHLKVVEAGLSEADRMGVLYGTSQALLAGCAADV